MLSKQLAQRVESLSWNYNGELVAVLTEKNLAVCDHEGTRAVVNIESSTTSRSIRWTTPNNLVCLVENNKLQFYDGDRLKKLTTVGSKPNESKIQVLESINHVEWSANENLLLVFGNESIRLKDIRDPQRNVAVCKGPYTSYKYDFERDLLAVGDSFGCVTIYEGTGLTEQMRSSQVFKGPITNLCFT